MFVGETVKPGVALAAASCSLFDAGWVYVSDTDWPPAAAAPSVSARSEPESETPVTETDSPPSETANALPGGTELARASSKWTVNKVPLTSAAGGCGGGVSSGPG